MLNVFSAAGATDATSIGRPPCTLIVKLGGQGMRSHGSAMSTPSSRCYYVVPTRSMMPSMKLSRNHEADVLMSRMARLLDPSMISSRQPEWRSGAASVKSCWIVSPGSPVYTFGVRKVWSVFAPVMADLLRFLNSRLASGAVEPEYHGREGRCQFRGIGPRSSPKLGKWSALWLVAPSQ